MQECKGNCICVCVYECQCMGDPRVVCGCAVGGLHHNFQQFVNAQVCQSVSNIKSLSNNGWNEARTHTLFKIQIQHIIYTNSYAHIHICRLSA